MNATGDEHVSFGVKQLVVSPCGRYVAVSMAAVRPAHVAPMAPGLACPGHSDAASVAGGECSARSLCSWASVAATGGRLALARPAGGDGLSEGAADAHRGRQPPAHALRRARGQLPAAGRGVAARGRLRVCGQRHAGQDTPGGAARVQPRGTRWRRFSCRARRPWLGLAAPRSALPCHVTSTRCRPALYIRPVQLCVFHVGSGRLVATLRPHKASIRDLHMNSGARVLATCGFDKVVRVLA
jgi:hypothetical protein